jgi:hypothetical protein
MGSGALHCPQEFDTTTYCITKVVAYHHSALFGLNTRQKPAKCLVSLAVYGSEKSNNWLKKKRKPTPLRNLTHNMCTGVFLK